jgi:hypothetical protein
LVLILKAFEVVQDDKGGTAKLVGVTQLNVLKMMAQLFQGWFYNITIGSDDL